MERRILKITESTVLHSTPINFPIFIKLGNYISYGTFPAESSYAVRDVRHGSVICENIEEYTAYTHETYENVNLLDYRLLYSNVIPNSVKFYKHC